MPRDHLALVPLPASSRAATSRPGAPRTGAPQHDRGRRSVIRVSDEPALRSYLVERGLAAAGEPIGVEVLRGGVSCDVVRVTSGATELVLKQALPRLRVEAEWLADVRRIVTEREALAVWRGVVPRCVPALAFADDANHLFAMEAAPREAATWKEALLRGALDFEVGGRVARALAAVHGATARDPAVAERFRDVELFVQLRIDPYWRTIARRHPQLASDVDAQIERTLATRIALVHGDFSPKNILVWRDRLLVLDFECAHYGDPAYDLAFVTNHLLLKAVKNRRWAAAYLDLAREVARTYLALVDFADAARLESDAVRSLAFLLLARVDGKSPVEYLVDEGDRALVRAVSYAMVRDHVETYADASDLLQRAVRPRRG